MRLPRVVAVVLGGSLLGFVAFLAAGNRASDLIASAPTTTLSPPTTPPPPTTDTSLSTTTMGATTTTEGRKRLVIHGVGDVNTDTSYIPALATEGHEHAWEGLEGLFIDDDLTVINLECTPSELGTPLDKDFVFRCDPDSLPVMRAFGVDVVNLANNHSRDHGAEALVDGRENLESVGIRTVGVGQNRSEAAAPAVVEVGGWTIAVVGFGGVVPNPGWLAGDDTPGMADGDTIETMVEIVESAAELADLVIVTIHWGVELETEPTPEDRARAEAIVDAGADVIFGHHPHRLQPMEEVGGAPVAWSLGNFVWPNLSVAGSTTAIARVVVEPDRTVTSCLIPAFIVSPGRPEMTADPEC